MTRPTAADKRRFAKIVALGCLACRLDGVYTAPEIHHVRKYGYRDHAAVIPLCSSHHRPTAAIPGVFNRHGNPIEFAAQFGDDDELLLYLQRLINETL